MAFSSPVATNSFTDGMTDWRHVHQRVEEHEKSHMHRSCAESYFLMANRADINSLLSCNQMSVHREQARKRRQVLKRVIDIVKMMGNKMEAAYTLADF